ncbi:hypothetical protein B0H65DRAFT_577050 [Neurospora tetraspora]|uniref:FAR1 domain-containing protein n=1 Tax=Neurospora tetraspora TaxID=94610 RepID=A0AAE0JE16_9PEZI|nr:hypothetical protein B0H65DRAFT_577050 [Neurospora tetraspora]
MPPWAPDATIEFTGSQLLHLNQTNQVYEEWEGFGDSDGDSDSHSSENPPPQPASKSSDPTGDPEDDDLFDPRDAILNPPSGAIHPSTTIEGLQESVNKWALNHGFAVTRGQGRGTKPRVPAKDYTRYYFFCDRFGKPRKSTATIITIRKTASRKCGCNWKAFAKKDKEGVWHFRLHDKAVHRVHNHGQTHHPSEHTQHRRLQPEVFEAIDEASKLNGMPAREVDSVLRKRFPGSVHTRRDIYNARARIRLRNLNG